MVEVKIAAKKTIKGYIKSSKNCVPCRITGGVALRGPGSFVLFDFGMLKDKKDCKIIIGFKNISGNGFVNIKIDNFNKQYNISNNKKIEIPYVPLLHINRSKHCTGELAINYIGAICNSKQELVDDDKSFNFDFDQESADIQLINSTFSSKENKILNAQKNVINKLTNNIESDKKQHNGEDVRAFNKKLFTNNKDMSIDFKQLKCNSHDISKIDNGNYKLILFFGGTSWSPKHHKIFFNMMKVYDIIVLSAPEFSAGAFSGIDIKKLIDNAFCICCDTPSYKSLITKSNMVSNIEAINISKLFNISTTSYKECIDKILLDSVSVDKINIKNIIKKEDNKIMTIVDKVTSDTKFKIIVPAYNSEKWIKKTLDSIACQNYVNYDVCVVDDASTDKSQSKIIENHCKAYDSKENRWRYILNKTRKGALFNIVNAIKASECNDEDVIVTLDGDDWFYNEHVLDRVRKEYEVANILITYGQYISYPSNTPGHCSEYSQAVITNRSFRKDEWRMSHLRTFKYKLFSRIKPEDLMSGKRHFEMAWDLALMFPMSEMAGSRIKFIKDFLYVYNRENPLNDDKVNLGLQARTNGVIRRKPKYDYVDFNQKEEEVAVQDNAKLYNKKELPVPQVKKMPAPQVKPAKESRTSISDNTNYPDFCKIAAEDDRVFKTFREAPIYIETLEHVSYKYATQYVDKILNNKNDIVMKNLELFKTNDLYGTPQIKNFDKAIGRVSPTTTRYISILNDMINIFGDMSGWSFSEVGAGYGGQCKIIHNAFDVKEYIIVDLDEPMMLIKKYLSKFDISPKLISAKDLTNKSSDLFISNYAFSECNREIQELYLENLAKNAKNGFMLCNFISNRFKVKSYTLQELTAKIKSYGREVFVEEEAPRTFRGNKLVYWKS